jgi:hypothetical protein
MKSVRLRVPHYYLQGQLFANFFLSIFLQFIPTPRTCVLYIILCINDVSFVGEVNVDVVIQIAYAESR